MPITLHLGHRDRKDGQLPLGDGEARHCPQDPTVLSHISLNSQKKTLNSLNSYPIRATSPTSLEAFLKSSFHFSPRDPAAEDFRAQSPLLRGSAGLRNFFRGKGAHFRRCTYSNGDLQLAKRHHKPFKRFSRCWARIFRA